MKDEELNAEIGRRFGWYSITWDNKKGREPYGNSLVNKELPDFLLRLGIPKEVKYG